LPTANRVDSHNTPDLPRDDPAPIQDNSGNASRIICLAWNAEGLAKFGRELALANLATNTGADVIVVSEAELRPSEADFKLEGYTTFSPLTDPGAKTRTLILVESKMATDCNATCRADLMSPEVSSVWVELGPHTRRAGSGQRAVSHGPLLICGVYREWEDTLITERTKIDILVEQMARATSGSSRVAVMGDLNLDSHRGNDMGYYRRSLLNEFTNAAERLGLLYLKTDWTWQSHGRFLPSSSSARALPTATAPISSISTPGHVHIGDGNVRSVSAAAPGDVRNGPPNDDARTHRKACLDHVYVSGLANTSVKLLDNAASDHRPLVLGIAAGNACNAERRQPIWRRNFKKIKRCQMEAALDKAEDWSKIHKMRDVERIHSFLVEGITRALDDVAPFEEIKVKKGAPLYLSSTTLERMRERDDARTRGLDTYRELRNRCNVLVAKDKRKSNMDVLLKAGDCPRTLWQIADSALGKSRPLLPNTLTKVDGSETVTAAETADLVNRAYVSKVERLRSSTANNIDVPNNNPSPPPSEPDNNPSPLPTEPGNSPPPLPTETDNNPSPPAWPPLRRQFCFSFASAGKIAKTIRGLKATEALGIDEIPVSILKKSVDTLAAPIAHLCNMSLATGVVPSGFKVGRISPIFKGGGKSRKEPASYRPVAILPAMSKIIEQIVKADLEAHLRNTGGLPNAQFGFRSRRGCTTALGTAHAGWLSGLGKPKNCPGSAPAMSNDAPTSDLSKPLNCPETDKIKPSDNPEISTASTTRGRVAARTQVVGIMSYDLSAAFDTVGAAELLPKLVALGITGKALDWFGSYLSGGFQCVVWNGATSSRIEVRFGVRQGSILGPVLFITLMADLPAYLKTHNIVIYADDVNLWVSGPTAEYVAARLTETAKLMTSYATKNGLALNAGKTQLLFSKGAGKHPPTVRVGSVDVVAADTLELLGVTFDRAMTTAPHDRNVLIAARQRAALVARLGHHLPKGRYLRQLATGLFGGKIGHALAAVASPRLSEEEKKSCPNHRATQICMNDVARTITGTRRSDHITVGDLLEMAGLESLNRRVVAAIAMEAWNSFHSDDGERGGRNPLGTAIFGEEAPDLKQSQVSPKSAPVGPNNAPGSDLASPNNTPVSAPSKPWKRPQKLRTTRASEAGHTIIRMRGIDTLATHAGVVWNASPSLRLAVTRGEAKITARALARAAPI
jgi:hypothetical protein